MTEYQITGYPELSAVRTPNGTIYHIRGADQLNDGGRVILPVNRSYSPDVNGERHQGLTKYRKNKLIHEDANHESLLGDKEIVLDIYGRPLLFLQNDGDMSWYSSELGSNGAVSGAAYKLADGIGEKLLRSGFTGDYKVGVFGSHQASLNGVDSDMDLVAWVGAELKAEFLSGISEVFQEKGYRSSKDTGKDAEYAARYSKRLSVPQLAGWYLANKRMRWISPGGTSTSLQCLNSGYDHQAAAEFVMGINEDWEGREVMFECNPVSAVDSYNFPKIWQVEVDGKLIQVVSFSWTHQGMGDDNGQFDKKYIFKGAEVTNSQGQFLYLKDENHYLLPKSLL